MRDDDEKKRDSSPIEPLLSSYPALPLWHPRSGMNQIIGRTLTVELRIR